VGQLVVWRHGYSLGLKILLYNILMDNFINYVWPIVTPYTMLSKKRIQNNIHCIDEIVRKNISGDIVEIGVYKGGSVLSMLLALQHKGVVRPTRLYDTFTGLTAATEHDVELGSGKHFNERVKEVPWFQCIADIETVKKTLSLISYPSDAIHYHVGDIMKCTEFPEQIALLRLDTDFYDSTKYELEHFYPRVSSGGIVIIDDYGYWKGSRKATDEFLEKYPDIRLLPIDGTGVYFYKP